MSALRAPVAEDEILFAVDASAHHARGLVRRRRRRVRREVHPSLVQVCVEFGEDDVRVGLGHVPRDDESRADGFVRVGLPRLAAPLVANLMVGLGGLGAAEVVEHDAGEGILVRLDRAPTRVRVARVGLPGGRGRGRGDRRRWVGVPRRAVGGDGGDGPAGAGAAEAWAAGAGACSSSVGDAFGTSCSGATGSWIAGGRSDSGASERGAGSNLIAGRGSSNASARDGARASARIAGGGATASSTLGAFAAGASAWGSATEPPRGSSSSSSRFIVLNHPRIDGELLVDAFDEFEGDDVEIVAPARHLDARLCRDGDVEPGER